MSNTTAMSDLTSDCTLKTEINIYYDLQPTTKPAAPLLIALHGYGSSKRHMMREAQLMAPHGFAIASLQGMHQHLRDPKDEGGPLRFGFGWLTNFHPEESIAIHHRALLDLMEKLVTDKVADPSRIFLLGFSQSCALNYRFAFSHADRLRGIVGICGGIPGDWEANESYQPTTADIFHLAAKRDEFYTPERIRNYEQQLRTRTSALTFKTYDAGHEITEPMRIDVRQWLSDQTSD